MKTHNLHYLDEIKGRDAKLRYLEEDFYRQVNQVISERITPVYNAIILVFAAVFAYFVVLE